MKFVKKTTEELEKMTPADLDQYKNDLEASNKAELKAELSAENKTELEKATNELKDFMSTEIGKQLLEVTTTGSSEKEGQFVSFAKKNSKEFEESNKYYRADMTIKAAALMTTANVLPNVANGFSPLFGNYIDTEIGHTPKPDNIILPLITVKNQPGTESIWYSDRINEDGDAEFIAEGALKPLADADYQTSKAPVKEVAVRWKFTKRLMAHAPSVVVDFAEHANELVEQKIDDQLLNGTGVGNNLTGLETIASAFIVPTQLAGYYADANIYDAIMAIATQVRLANFKGSLTAVLNTVWMAKMKGIKNADGDYIIPPFVSPDGTMVGDVKVVFSNKIPDTDILVGDLKKFNLVMAENITYDEGYENDDFSKNLVSKKLEAFMGTYIKSSDAGSIVYDAIADVLTDIEVIP